MSIISVSELTKQIKQTLETGFPHFSVVGEISGFKPHNSGHWYFNLKDSDAVICCTMWKSNNGYVFFTPRDGMKIIVNGKLNVYAPRGNYQVDVRSMRPAGEGELQAAFELLKKKLAAEGLFDQDLKKPIPQYPQRIGIVTAPDGAALRDMISIAKRRFPLAELLIASTRVQGVGSAESIVRGINNLNAAENVDVIILARGGGSIEDLWAFNEEIVARAIFESGIPVISGVGHEIDFTIADFVADLRAPTPSAAMEIATPSFEELALLIDSVAYNNSRRIKKLCELSHERIVNALYSYGFRQPLDIVRRYYQQTDNVSYKINRNADRKLMMIKNSISLLTKSIESHDIRKILKKGFVIVKQDNKPVTRAAGFKYEKDTKLQFYDREIELNKDNFADGALENQLKNS